MKQVTLTTDGSCLFNPGPSGWAWLLRFGAVEPLLSGSELGTTNNRMELRAVIAGLAALRESCCVKVVTDSQYVQRGMKTYITRWVSAGWISSRGKRIANRDLWEELMRESGRHQVEWIWVRGHTANPDQNRCDRVAQGGGPERSGGLMIDGPYPIYR